MATIYDIITTDIITALEAGVAPWQQPWSEASAPTNLVSRKAYRGVNVWLLLAARRTSPYWLTFKQALDLGGHVRKGERGRRIVYWHVSEATDDATGQVERHFAPRYSTVFNVEQCDGLTVPALEAPAVTVDPNEASPLHFQDEEFPCEAKFAVQRVPIRIVCLPRCLETSGTSSAPPVAVAHSAGTWLSE